LLEPGGYFVAWKGAASSEEKSAGAVAAGIVGLEPGEVIPVVPYEGARDHSLHVFRKTGETPERFPRRAGMATKRPLA
jgi:16S rRNA (guanine527-N7)-methyltransferase